MLARNSGLILCSDGSRMSMLQPQEHESNHRKQDVGIEDHAGIPRRKVVRLDHLHEVRTAAPNRKLRDRRLRQCAYRNYRGMLETQRPRIPTNETCRHGSSGQAYFLTAFSIALPALARSSGTMTG